ncbi:hypothetical protein, partial [Paenibacillus chitinolyticus]|uniref:hypothetical protein n=1 Tax=Paenibacillus chitinolyticus TaxID=79263 RepID=UPI00295E7124
EELLRQLLSHYLANRPVKLNRILSLIRVNFDRGWFSTSVIVLAIEVNQIAKQPLNKSKLSPGVSPQKLVHSLRFLGMEFVMKCKQLLSDRR